MFHVFSGYRATLQVVAMTIIGEAAWINTANLNGTATTVVGSCMTLVLGYISISALLGKRRHEQRKLDLEDEVARIRALDEARAESLSGQLAEVHSDLEKMRATLHAVSDEAHLRGLEAAGLRIELAEAHKNFLTLSAQFAAAALRSDGQFAAAREVADGQAESITRIENHQNRAP